MGMEKDNKEKKEKKDKKEKGEKKDKKDKKESKKRKAENADAGDAPRPSPSASPPEASPPEASPSGMDDFVDAIMRGDDDFVGAPDNGQGSAMNVDQGEQEAWPEEDGGAAAFWAEVGVEEETPDQTGDQAEDEPETARISSFLEGGGTVLHVPAEAAERISQKIERISTMTGTMISLKAGTLKIAGSSDEARDKAETYARAVLERQVDAEALRDLSVLPIPKEETTWYDSIMQEVEKKDSKVLLFPIQPRQAKIQRWKVGEVVMAQAAEGRAAAVATVVSIKTSGLRVRWIHDESEQDILKSLVRSTWQIGVFGEASSRLRAEMHLLRAVEEKVPNMFQAQLQARYNCCAKPGGQSIEAMQVNLKFNSSLNLLMAAKESGGIAQATGVLDIIFIADKREEEKRNRQEEAKGKGKGKLKGKDDAEEEEKGKGKGKGKGPFLGKLWALIGGEREGRWLAGQLLQIFATGLDNRNLSSLPDYLSGDYETVKVPEPLIGAVMGKFRSRLIAMMEEHGTFAIFFGKTGGDSQPQENESGDYMQQMLNSRRSGSASLLAIFGPMRNRFAMRIRVEGIVEGEYRGFYQEPLSGEEINLHVGIAVDKVWLEANPTTGESNDFEADAKRTQAKLVAAASGCAVESGGRVVFLAGTFSERQRAREYTHWLTSKRLFGVHPHINDLESRSDALSVTVHNEVLRMRAFRDEILKFQQHTNSLIFQMEGQDGDLKKLLIAGIEVATKGSEFASKLRKDCETIIEHHWKRKEGESGVLDENPKPSADAWWDWKKNEWSSEGWSGWGDNWKKDSVAPPQTPAVGNVKPPATPAFGVAGPATPAMPRGVAPPATPAFGGGVAPPATPGMPGRGVAPPATPGLPGGGAPPPATPALPMGVAPPATPAVPRGVAPPATPGLRMGGVAPPATPGFPGGTAPPQTPAFPGGSAAPETPAFPGGGAAPATPAFPGGNAAPATPAFPGGAAAPNTPGVMGGVAPPATPAFPRGNMPGVAPPATPAFPQATAGGSSSSTTKRPVPAPQTPAIFAAAASVTKPAAKQQEPRKVAAPQTPGILATNAQSPTKRDASAAAISMDSVASSPSSSGPAAPPPKRRELVSSTLEDLLVTMPADGVGVTKMETKSFPRCITWRTLHPEQARAKSTEAAKVGGSKIGRAKAVGASHLPASIAAAAPVSPPRSGTNLLDQAPKSPPARRAMPQRLPAGVERMAPKSPVPAPVPVPVPVPKPTSIHPPGRVPKPSSISGPSILAPAPVPVPRQPTSIHPPAPVPAGLQSKPVFRPGQAPREHTWS